MLRFASSLFLGLVVGCTAGSEAPPDDGDPGGDTSTTSPPSYEDPPPSTDAGELPVALRGGSIEAIGDGTRAVVTDVDAHAIHVVSLVSFLFEQTVELEEGDEPFRVAEDGTGLVHVTLRGSGAVAVVDPARGTLVARHDVCAEPRGIAYDASTDEMLVACASGELLSVAADGITGARTLGGDLRDVVVTAEHIWVSRFRSAEVLEIDRATDEVAVRVPETLSLQSDRLGGTEPMPGTLGETSLGSDVPVGLPLDFAPRVAWRMRPAPDGDGIALLHQRASNGFIQLTSAVAEEPESPEEPDDGAEHGAYGGGRVDLDAECQKRLVHATVTLFRPDGTVESLPALEDAILPVDFVYQSRSDYYDGPPRFLLAAAGNDHARSVMALPWPTLRAATSCVPLREAGKGGAASPTAVIVDHESRYITLSRRFRLLQRMGDRSAATLPSVAEMDWRGYATFHDPPADIPMACASCHPEGAEDGHTWGFKTAEGEILRRSQTLLGGVLATAPFHWAGDVPSFHDIADNTMRRMGAMGIDDEASARLADWVDGLPAPHPSREADDRSERGRALFEGTAGCTECHAGPLMTMPESVDVGTGGAFQVPSLVGVAHRAPYLHDGCAGSLEAALTGCEGAASHVGVDLAPEDLADVVAYLENL